MDTTLTLLNGSVDFMVSAWLDAKSRYSGSLRTATDYNKTLRSFRDVCQSVGMDLDGDARALSLLAQPWASHSTKGKEVTPNTHNLRLAIVSSFYGYAVKHGMLPANPIELVERRRVQAYASAQPIEAKQVKKLLAAIDRSSIVGKRDYALLQVGLTTGRRAAELAGLRMGDVSIEADTATLRWTRVKGGKTMHDKLASAVGRALLDYLHTAYGSELGHVSSAAPVWLSNARNPNNGRGGPLGTQGIADVCAKRLGVSKSHVLRHTVAWTMEEAGAKLSDIQRQLGHANAATTSRYLEAMHAGENPYGETLATLFGA